jgi:hypothetical protein
MSRIILFLLLSGTAFGQVASIIDPTNRCDWVPGQTVGVLGGIPGRSTIYKTEAAGTSATTINTDLAACPSNQVVLLSAGSYTIDTPLVLKDGVTLRGAGPDATYLVGSGVFSVVSIAGPDETFSSAGDLYSGYTKGSSNIVLVGGGPAVTVGKTMIIYQQDNTNFLHSWDGGDNHVRFLLKVQSVSNSTNVAVWPPIPWGFTAGFNPKYLANTGSFIERAGVESLTIKPDGSADYPLRIRSSVSCWASNVVVTNIQSQCGIYMYQTLQCEVRRCSVLHSSSTGDGYGIDMDLNNDGAGHTGSWVEDNIFDGMYYSIIASGVAGSAFSYNFSTNEHAQSGITFQTAAYNATHSPGGMMVLWEGNFGNSMTADKIHGSVSYQTLWRNRFHGLDSNTNFLGAYSYVNSHQAMVWLTEYSRKWNAVGNALGASWSSSNPAKYFYEISAAQWDSAATDDNGGIWMLGFNSSGQPLDTLVKSTMIRYQNYDFFHQYSTNETAVGGSPTVDSSLLFGSTPSFFGTNRFPAVAPELTPVYVNIPAHDRYLGVVSSGSSSGSVTANQTSLGGASIGGRVSF